MKITYAQITSTDSQRLNEYLPPTAMVDFPVVIKTMAIHIETHLP